MSASVARNEDVVHIVTDLVLYKSFSHLLWARRHLQGSETSDLPLLCKVLVAWALGLQVCGVIVLWAYR